MDAFQSRLQALKDEHPKAVHHCWAVRFLDKEQSTDDGEPSGTAGRPMLGQLIKSDVHQVAAVVVRYYGGVNLGTGGLIKAYRNAVDLALQEADIISVDIKSFIKVEYRYDKIAEIEKVMRQPEWDVHEQVYGDQPYIVLAVKPSAVDKAITRVKSIVGQLYLEEVTDDLEIDGLKISVVK